MDLDSFSHGYGQLSYHVVLVPKYRQDIFSDEEVKKGCERIFRKIARKYGNKIHELQIMPDHLHLFVGLTSEQSMARTIHLFKGISARKLIRAISQDQGEALGRSSLVKGEVLSLCR